jgi:hypothetical protein
MIEMGKRYQTRDGRAVRILCVDGPGEEPVVGLIDEMVASWSIDGIYFLHPASEKTRHLMERSDLVLVPTKHEGWVALHIVAAPESLPIGPVYVTREGAAAERDRQHLHDNLNSNFIRLRRIILAHVTWED